MKQLCLILMFLISTICLFGQSKSEYKKQICDHRKSYKADFLTNERSPIKSKKDLKKIKFYKPNARYKVAASFEKIEDAPVFQMATYDGKSQDYRKYGLLKFKLDGKMHQLYVYQNLNLINVPGYKDYLFLPFKDTSNGTLTYGGGRYLDLRIDDIQQDRYIIDFNKCYNPWCAYSSGYSCPIPPKENNLGISIPAGEKTYIKK